MDGASHKAEAICSSQYVNSKLSSQMPSQKDPEITSWHPVILVPCDLLKLTTKESTERTVVWWLWSHWAMAFTGRARSQHRLPLQTVHPRGHSRAFSLCFPAVLIAKVGESVISTPVFYGVPSNSQEICKYHNPCLRMPSQSVPPEKGDSWHPPKSELLPVTSAWGELKTVL